MPTIANVIQDLALYLTHPNTEIVVGTAKQEPGAGCRLFLARLMAGKGAIAHVVGSWRRNLERLCGKNSRGVNSPRTIGARLSPIQFLAAAGCDFDHLMIVACGSNIGNVNFSLH